MKAENISVLNIIFLTFFALSIFLNPVSIAEENTGLKKAVFYVA